MSNLRLGVNIDHVATIRNARGGDHPDPLRAALIAQDAGADGITIHLREDRRHIRDHDLVNLKSQLRLPINLEMAATDEMLAIALLTKPHAVCIVPEKREEITTEGGLDVVGNISRLAKYIDILKKEDILISLFIESEKMQIEAAKQVGADIVELHTGGYCNDPSLLGKIQAAAALAEQLGLECHAGHGLNYHNVIPIAAIPQILELNIGHFLIGEAIFIGLEAAIKKMLERMRMARTLVIPI